MVADRATPYFDIVTFMPNRSCAWGLERRDLRELIRGHAVVINLLFAS